MNRKTRLILAAALLGAALAAPADAAAGPVRVENLTGRPVCSLYFARAGHNLWGPETLSRCLAPGQAVTLNLHPDHGLCDLRIIFDDGRPLTYFGLDLRLYAWIRLKPEEAEIFERDPR